MILFSTFNVSAQLQKKPIDKDELLSFSAELDNWTSIMESGNADAVKAVKEKIETAMVVEIQKKNARWQPGSQTRSTSEKSGGQTRGRGTVRSDNNSTLTRQQEIYQKISSIDISEQNPKSIARLDKLFLEFYDTIEE